MPSLSQISPPTHRSLRRTLIELVVTMVILTVVLTGVGWLITGPLASTMAHEDSVNRWFAAHRTGALTSLADLGTFVGQTVTGAVVLALLGTGFALWRRTWWPLVFVVVFDLGLGLFYLAGTTLDPRQRPPVHILQSGLVADASFPSGHTGTALGIAAVATALLWSYTRVPAGLLAILVVVPLWTMLARLYVGAHHVSDVLTELLVASAWAWTCARLLLPPRTAQR